MKVEIKQIEQYNGTTGDAVYTDLECYVEPKLIQSIEQKCKNVYLLYFNCNSILTDEHSKILILNNQD